MAFINSSEKKKKMSDKTRSGYVVLVGKPNAGKSTLLNSILEFKLSIVTPKPQTTRKRVLGIHSTESEQIIFLDTPGLLEPKYEMQSSMMRFVDESLEEADVLVFLQDVAEYKTGTFENKTVKKVLQNYDGPKILVLNKIDKFKNVKDVLPKIAEISGLGIFNEIVPISAVKNENTPNLINAINNYLPEGPFYYNPEMLSTEQDRFFVSEMIREQIFLKYSQELPYSTEVQILEFKEREVGKWFIHAEIVVERDSQKKIIIGEKGEKIKKVSTVARKAIEEYLNKEVYLELFVKVREDWRNKRSFLKSFGY